MLPGQQHCLLRIMLTKQRQCPHGSFVPVIARQRYNNHCLGHAIARYPWVLVIVPLPQNDGISMDGRVCRKVNVAYDIMHAYTVHAVCTSKYKLRGRLMFHSHKLFGALVDSFHQDISQHESRQG